MQFLRRLHGFLLNLYPKAYRAEYGEELQAVFTLSLEDASEQGWWSVAAFMIRELTAFPQAVILAHLRERRRVSMLKRFNSFFDFAHGSPVEFLAALFPFFLLGGVLPLINLLGASEIIPVPSPLLDGLGIILIGLFLLIFAAGSIAGLPRWVLPYLGTLLALFSVYVFSGWLEDWFYIPYTRLYNTAWFFGQAAYAGSLWVGLSVVAFLLAAMIRFIPALHKFQHDWTLPGFILYGAAPFALLFTFDDYVHEELWELLSFAILGIGMWLYLRSDDPRTRFRVLFGSMTAALFLAAVAKALILSSPAWPWPRDSSSWSRGLMSTVIMWMWIALSFLLSAALSQRQDGRSASPSR